MSNGSLTNFYRMFMWKSLVCSKNRFVRNECHRATERGREKALLLKCLATYEREAH